MLLSRVPVEVPIYIYICMPICLSRVPSRRPCSLYGGAVSANNSCRGSIQARTITHLYPNVCFPCFAFYSIIHISILFFFFLFNPHFPFFFFADKHSSVLCSSRIRCMESCASLPRVGCIEYMAYSLIESTQRRHCLFLGRRQMAKTKKRERKKGKNALLVKGRAKLSFISTYTHPWNAGKGAAVSYICAGVPHFVDSCRCICASL